MTIQIRLHPSALRQATAAVRWWVRNRPKAPDLFRTELARALDLLEHATRAGALCSELGPRFVNVRRVLLPKTRHWIFYLHDAEAERIDVVAVWSNRRGAPPPLPS